MTKSTGTADRNGRAAGLCVRLAGLGVGMAATLSLLGTAGLYRAILDPLPRTTVMAVAVALLSAAIGPWLPQRIIARSFRSSRRGEGLPTATVSDLVPTGLAPTREGLLWVLLAMLCVAGGAVTLIVTWATRLIERAHHWVLNSFLLSRAEVLTADLVSLAGALAVPWLIFGLVFATLHNLAACFERPGREGGGWVGSMLLGAALGLAAGRLPGFESSPGRTVLLGTIPLFLVAVLAVVRAGRRRPWDERETDAPPPLPEWASDGGHVLLGGLVVWGVLAGTVVATWPRVIQTSLKAAPVLQSSVEALLILCMAAGVLLGGRLARRSQQPAGDVGLAMVLGGACAGAGVALFALLAGVGQGRPLTIYGATTYPTVGALGLAGLGAGGVLPFLRRAVIVQSGSPALACAQVLGAVLSGAVLGATCSSCWITPAAGTLVSLSASVLLVLATGGLLVIFDVGRPPGRRGVRLAVVFVALAGMMVGLPTAGRWWLRWQGSVSAFREGTWLTALLVGSPGRSRVVIEPGAAHDPNLAPEGAAMTHALRAVMRLRGPIRRCWLITAGGLEVGAGEAVMCPSITMGWYDPVAAEAFKAGATLRTSPLPHQASRDPLLLSLRETKDRYDLIVIESIPGGHEGNGAIWSLETLQRFAHRLAPKGMLAGLVYPADHSRVELAVMTATFAESVPGFTRAALVGFGPEQALVLLGYLGTRPEWDWDAAARNGMHRIGQLRSFLRLVPGAVPNTLLRPSLRRPPESGEGGVRLVQYVSQTPDWRPLAPSVRPVLMRPPSMPAAPSAPRSRAATGPLP
jgi:hypothetical protein